MGVARGHSQRRFAGEKFGTTPGEINAIARESLAVGGLALQTKFSGRLPGFPDGCRSAHTPLGMTRSSIPACQMVQHWQ